MTLHRKITEIPGERAEGNAIAAHRTGDNSARHFHHGPELRVIPQVLGILPLLTEKTERALPPLDVMISRNNQRRDFQLDSMKKDVRRLELAVAGALAQVAGNHDGGGAQTRKKFFKRLDLLDVGKAAKVQVGEMRDDDGGTAHAAEPPLSGVTISHGYDTIAPTPHARAPALGS